MSKELLDNFAQALQEFEYFRKSTAEYIAKLFIDFGFYPENNQYNHYVRNGSDIKINLMNLHGTELIIIILGSDYEFYEIRNQKRQIRKALKAYTHE